MDYLIVSDEIEQTCIVMRTVLSAMLDRPEKLKVTSHVSTTGVVLRVSCDANEVSKLIGKQGRIARALRTVLMAVSRQTSFHLDITPCSPETQRGSIEVEEAVFCS